MYFLPTLLPVLLLLLPAAARNCGTKDPSPALRSASRRFAAQARLDPSPDPKFHPIVIPTHFHILRINETLEGGDVPKEQIEAQISVLNADFRSAGIFFDLLSTTRTTNVTWAHDGAETAMKTSLREGGYESLNIYFVNFWGGLLGYAYFPVAFPTAWDRIHDGVTVLYSSVPGGSATSYDLGRTATHEVGHWLGVYHTFQGGCEEGDEVEDTPAEASPTFGCPEGKDTCVGEGVAFAGLDPIHNFMDYSVDACMTEFSKGQRMRMRQFWTVYRENV